MAVPTDATIIMSAEDRAHLAPADVAAFVDGTVDADARRRIMGHLASCGACRAEVADVLDVVATVQQHRRQPVWIGAVAAAALVAMVVWPRGTGQAPPVHREAPMTTVIAPSARYPVGLVDSAPSIVWTAVPYADRYRLRLFTGDGSVIWEREGSDTTLALPSSAQLRPGEIYYWSVEAQIGFDRTVASPLIAFSVRFPR